jgi:signal transduction histidine kinase/CheY-like chemotaxis protein
VTGDLFPLEDTHASLEDTTSSGEIAGRGPDDDRAALMIVSGEDPGRTYVLDRKEMLVGRAVDATICLPSPEVSRRHASIAPISPTGFLLRDLESRNGTKVNGVPIVEKRLEFGDKITFGNAAVLVYTRFDPRDEELKIAQRLEAIGSLAGGIAHDFNNLLAVLLANITFLKGLPKTSAIGDPSIAAALDDSELAGRRAMDLVRELLAFARRGKYDERAVHVSLLLSDIVRSLERTLPKTIEVEADIQPDLAVSGDRGQLQQAVLSLCHHARDGMVTGGRIVIEARLVAGNEIPTMMRRRGVQRALLLSVSDTGPGLDEIRRQRLFEPFYSRQALGIGTGLGLAMVYGTVRNHGGEIRVASEIDKGTTFRMFLPSAMMHNQHPTPVLGSKRLDPSRELTVLLVDDQALVRRGAVRLLERLGCNVIEAKGGVEAVALYRVHREMIDLVILDLMMPDQDGEQTFHELATLDPTVCVLVSSGYSEDHYLRSIMQSGARGFLQKPYDLAGLEEAITRALGRGPR